MTTNYHTAIAYGAEATSANLNAPLGQLDDAIGDRAGDITTLTNEITTARGTIATLDGRLDVSLNEDGTVRNSAVGEAQLAASAVVNAKVAAAAAIEGSKIVAATTAARGTVELATDGENAASVAVQGNDSRLLTALQKTDLTDGGETTLHTHAAATPVDHGHTSTPGDGGALGNGVVVNANVGAAAAIEGSKIVAATTAARGTVELATDGEVAASVAVQGNDSRLLTAVQKTDLTDGGLTLLHTHDNAWGIVYVDIKTAATASAEAGNLMIYEEGDPGMTAGFVKIRTAYFHRPDSTIVNVTCKARVSADPTPAEAYAKIYVYNASNSAFNTEEIVQYGAGFADYDIRADVSALPEGIYTIEVSIEWVSMSPSGATAYMQQCVIQHN